MQSALDLLTGDAQAFREKIWAIRVHHHRVDPDELTAYFSLDDADRLLTASAIRAPGVRLVRDGSVLPENDYTSSPTLAGRPLTGLVDARKALEEFRSGATVVFQGLHRSCAPLTDLIAELELELGHPCQANAYLTPPGSQGFAVHSDNHDVFVLQITGTKQWELPAGGGSANNAEKPLLRPGDVMYLPTGTPHAARAREALSLHVTIGVNQLTWRGLLRRTLAEVVAQEPEEHLPAGFLDEPSAVADALAGRLTALAGRLREIDPTEAVKQEIRRFLTSRPTRLERGLVDGLRLETIDDDTLLRRRPGHPCVLVAKGDRLEVLLGDRSLDAPATIGPAMDAIRVCTELRPRDLPLDEHDRLVLVRRLVREGLLQVVPDR